MSDNKKQRTKCKISKEKNIYEKNKNKKKENDENKNTNLVWPQNDSSIRASDEEALVSSSSFTQFLKQFSYEWLICIF